MNQDFFHLRSHFGAFVARGSCGDDDYHYLVCYTSFDAHKTFLGRNNN
jgi:hypothetical protein